MSRATRMKWCSIAVAALALFGGELLRAETVSLRSGNGSIGFQDSLVTLLVGPVDGPFPAPFTPADFVSANTGPGAWIVEPHPAWISGLAGDSMAQWISSIPDGRNTGGTALYAIDFTLAAPAASATLNLQYSVDNVLGSGVNQGVFLNGTAISGNSTGGTFTSEFNITRNDIAPLLVAGTNTLYINATDEGGPAGLIFRALIETTPIPEPSSATILVGAIGLFLWFDRTARREFP